jgi:hypothetical protein
MEEGVASFNRRGLAGIDADLPDGSYRMVKNQHERCLDSLRGCL